MKRCLCVISIFLCICTTLPAGMNRIGVMIGPSYDMCSLVLGTSYSRDGIDVDNEAEVTRLLIGVTGANFFGKKARLGIGYHAAFGMTTEMRASPYYYERFDPSLLPLRSSVGIQGLWRWVIDDELTFELGLCGSHDSYSWVESDTETDVDSFYSITSFSVGTLFAVTYALSRHVLATVTVSLKGFDPILIPASRVYIDGNLTDRKGASINASMLFSLAYVF